MVQITLLGTFSPLNPPLMDYLRLLRYTNNSSAAAAVAAVVGAKDRVVVVGGGGDARTSERRKHFLPFQKKASDPPT